MHQLHQSAPVDSIDGRRFLPGGCTSLHVYARVQLQPYRKLKDIFYIDGGRTHAYLCRLVHQPFDNRRREIRYSARPKSSICRLHLIDSQIFRALMQFTINTLELSRFFGITRGITA
jgi:hypothetical protein